MNNFRLHLDIPLSSDQKTSEEIAQKIVDYLTAMNISGVELVQYRLSHDYDRGNKNYLDINENGHCTTNKLKIEYKP